MSDIAEYMRQGGPCIELNERCKVMDAASGCACAKAAAEIERLRAALRDLADCKTFTDREYMIGTARAALEGK